jgi:hypothetical protein
LTPAASAKVWFRMSDHVLRVGKPVRLVVPGCENGCGITREYYGGPVRIYLVRASVHLAPGQTLAKPPAGARLLGRYDDDLGLRFTPRAGGTFRLWASLPYPHNGAMARMVLEVSPAFRVRG